MTRDRKNGGGNTVREIDRETGRQTQRLRKRWCA